MAKESSYPPAPIPYQAGGGAAPVFVAYRSFRCQRQVPLLLKENHKPNLGARIAESTGQTAAECTAVVCCCPCGLANLVYLAAVKLPAGIVRRALCGAGGMTRRGVGFVRKRPGLLMNNRVLPFHGDGDDDGINFHATRSLVRLRDDAACPTKMASPELAALEKELSSRFYGTGFWRSPSRKE
ncbi:uncharacterized protein LOC121980083 [Zingiber officinale]|uniref:Uncharacterized protein n=1 Tax=Zingiber officinale TaxID=94328 RepID=A0A8J5GRG8_ZINOF|nr:uncharacterized protein LOC121980083 [Zingiber officinale]KAG6508728.1 hypothetical protein ZIOFF_034108 [Zingiber officinale]